MRTILPADKNPFLRTVAKPVPTSEIKSAHIRKLISDMKRLLEKEEYGVALAAPQVGESLRIFIVSGRALALDAKSSQNKSDTKSKNMPNQPPPPDQIYINPELIKLSRTKRSRHEGCLSIWGMWGIVPRAEKATVRAYDENGKRFTRGASGFLAHIFQHEMDHLEGILYVDKTIKIYDERNQKSA